MNAPLAHHRMHAPRRVPVPEAFGDLLQTQGLLLRGCGQTASSWSGPQKGQRAAGPVAGLVNHRKMQGLGGGETGGAGGRVWGTQRPIFSLQFPPRCPACRTQKGACTPKRIFEIMGVFLFVFF